MSAKTTFPSTATLCSQDKDLHRPLIHEEKCEAGLTMQTPYMVMSVQANQAPRQDNLLAAICSWITLAGFIVLPGTFTSLAKSESLSDSKGGIVVQDAIRNIPLLALAVVCCLMGTIGSCMLWWKWRQNYVWLVARIFISGLLNSVTGLITTLVNVYTAQKGHWSVTAQININIVALYLGATLTLTLVYNIWLLEKIKTPHDRELAKQTKQ